MCEQKEVELEVNSQGAGGQIEKAQFSRPSEDTHTATW